jgi:hypothetical protein
VPAAPPEFRAREAVRPLTLEDDGERFPSAEVMRPKTAPLALRPDSLDVRVGLLDFAELAIAITSLRSITYRTDNVPADQIDGHHQRHHGAAPPVDGHERFVKVPDKGCCTRDEQK